MSSVAYAISDMDLRTMPMSDPSESTWERQPREEAVEWKIVAQGSNKRVELIFTQAPPAWSSAVLSELVGLLELPEGWNSYRARRVDFDAVKHAVDLLFNVADRHTPRPSIVPTARGGVQIEWHGENDVEIEVAQNGSIEFSSGDHETDFYDLSEATLEIQRGLREVAL